jgi:RNA polymerase II-associated protein 2
MAPDSSNTTPLDNNRRRAAIQTALQIEEKKRLRDRIADSVIECFDLPSQSGGIPAQALPRDVALFQVSLALFQPSDLDALILERNIDKRCGYSLCSNPNKQASHQGKRVFSKEVGYFIDKSEFEKWCSKECMDRGAFVRAQLSTEPAWLREGQNAEIKLLEEMKHAGDLADAIKV